MKSIATIIAFFFCNAFYAQVNARLHIPFEDYSNALTGGYEAPQFQAINLNDDGRPDLLVFDRKGSALRTYVYNEDAPDGYEYAPAYEDAFPAIPCWVIVRDYNGDGVDDLFTCGVTNPVTGIEVWIGSRNNGKLSFEAYDHGNGPYNIIYYERDDDLKQLYVGNNGIPGIVDVDKDGDIDVLAFQPSGGYLYYFQNMSQERGFGGDSLIFERVDDCWGNFYEGGLIPDIVLSEDKDACALPALAVGSNRHEGITISVFDRNADGLMDVLIGEVSSTNLIYVENKGTEEDAFATYKEVDFPSNDVPVDMQIFLSTSILDADLDGQHDLIVAPNSQFGTNTNQAAFYQGVDSSFQLVKEDWVVGSSLDLGTDSYPAFLDYNADGLQDIVVGSFGLIGLENGAETRLYLYENIGTSVSPAYKLVDDNYLNFLAFSSFDKSFTPAFGDTDGDGDVDLVLGTLSGDLVYVENLAGQGNPVNFSAPIFEYKGLDTENNTIKPAIADIDQDGLGDIIIGGRNSYSLEETIASLKLFTNVGSSGNADFDNDNVTLGLGSVNMKDGGTSKVTAAPHFYKNGETQLLFVGNETGRIAVFKVNNTGEAYELLYEDLLGQYYGRRIAIDVHDIDGDGYLELVAGNERGGLNFFDTVIQVSGEVSNTDEEIGAGELAFYPNPVTSTIYLEKEVDKVTIFDSMGRKCIELAGQLSAVDVRQLSAGVYYLTSEGYSSKFIKL